MGVNHALETCHRQRLQADGDGTGADGVVFRERIEAEWLPALERFAPQLILISAGFDGHVEDDIADLRLREQDYAWITAQLKNIATRHAGGRIVSVLEGGNTLSALGRSVVAHLKVFLGATV